MKPKSRTRSTRLLLHGWKKFIFAQTDPFKAQPSAHYAQRCAPLPQASQSSLSIAQAIQRLEVGFLKRNTAYKKAGVCLLDLTRQPRQIELNWTEAEPITSPSAIHGAAMPPAQNGQQQKHAQLMQAIDRLNQRYGRGTVGLGASGWQEQAPWRMRQAHLSQRFTTAVHEIPITYC